jgi:hypothetical protein
MWRSATTCRARVSAAPLRADLCPHLAPCEGANYDVLEAVSIEIARDERGGTLRQAVGQPGLRRRFSTARTHRNGLGAAHDDGTVEVAGAVSVDAATTAVVKNGSDGGACASRIEERAPLHHGVVVQVRGGHHVEVRVMVHVNELDLPGDCARWWRVSVPALRLRVAASHRGVARTCLAEKVRLPRLNHIATSLP